jgi:hypothetical protein
VFKRVALAVLTFVPYFWAQSTSTTPLLQASITRIFGNNVVSDVRIEGSVIAYTGAGDSGTFVYESNSAGATKLTLNIGGGTIFESAPSLDQSDGCYRTDTNGTRQDVAVHNCLSPNNWLFPLLAVRPEQQALVIAEESALASVNFKRSQAKPTKYSDVRSRLSFAELRIDPASQLPLSLEFQIHPEDDYNRDLPVQVRYSDYRELNGVWVPCKVEKLINGTLILEFTVTNFLINTASTL